MAISKEDILSTIKSILTEQFEVDSDAIQLESRLYEDLDIDSIDAVNLIIELKVISGRKMALEEFKEVETISDVVDAVHKAANERPPC